MMCFLVFCAIFPPNAVNLEGFSKKCALRLCFFLEKVYFCGVKITEKVCFQGDELMEKVLNICCSGR